MWIRLALSGLIALGLTLTLGGCSYGTFYVPIERLVYAPTTPASVAVSSQKTIKAPHKILGRVAAISWGGGEAARAGIQEQAAKIGANLIVDLRLERAFGRTSASGIAVLLLPSGGAPPAAAPGAAPSAPTDSPSLEELP